MTAIPPIPPAYCCSCRRGLTEAEWQVERLKSEPAQCPDCRAAGVENPGSPHYDRVERDQMNIPW